MCSCVAYFRIVVGFAVIIRVLLNHSSSELILTKRCPRGRKNNKLIGPIVT